MRLIDADKLIEFANNHKDKMVDANDIARFQTAFDVKKVTNQIQNKMFSAECYNDDFNGCEINNLLCMGDVYEILKGGGVDE